MVEEVSDCFMWSREDDNGSVWSREDDIAFERSLANNIDESEEKWEKIAADVPGKSVEQIKEHYELLVEDVRMIGSGCVPLPTYGSLEGQGSNDHVSDGGENSKKEVNSNAGYSNQRGKPKSEQDRRRGVPWSEEEHRLFLLGLDKLGKGDWRGISRQFVRTRTSTQIASHAQKFFDRQSGKYKRKRQKSIHDITTVSNTDKRQRQPVPQPPPGPPMDGTSTICQPVGESWVSEFGTSVNFPALPHAAPVPGSVVPDAPMNMDQMLYTIPSKPTAPMDGTSTIYQPVCESWVSEVGTSTICQPVGESWFSEVGTSVNFPALPHAAPVPGSVVPDAPMNMDQMLYTIPSKPTAPMDGTSTICQPVSDSWASEVGTSTICQPVGESWFSEVGTSVNFPALPHAAPVPGSVVPDAPMNMDQMLYTIPSKPTAPMDGTSTICQPVCESWASEVGTSTICQPVGESWFSEVGTSVNFPALPHAAPVPGSLVPGAPMSMDQMLYSVPSKPTAPR